MVVPAEGAELIPGYRLVKKLGKGGYGEVWKATAPGGLTKAIKVIFGRSQDVRAEQELKALNRIREVRHPFILSLERIETVNDQVLIVTELADASLQDRYEECRGQGIMGIPRPELLNHLRDAADALDYMNDHFGLQHLDIKPQNLLLVGGRVKIADFGLVKDLQSSLATATGGVTPIYAAPESFDGKITRYSDQYSLAIVYQEMLTGTRPFPGKSPLQLAVQHLNSPPLLDPLPPSDRTVIGRALAKIPGQRFPNCREMVEGLLQSNPAPVSLRNLVMSGRPTPGVIIPGGRSGVIHPVTGRAPAELLQMDTVVNPHIPLGELHTPLEDNGQEGARPPTGEPHPARTIALRPTLFLGIGGLASLVLRRLRQRLHARFGTLSAVPIFRFLHVDTGRYSLRQASPGSGADPLPPEDLVILPLRATEHYRQESKDILKWLDRRWLYGIPKSLMPEGRRPLGRLALVDNAPDLLNRLRDTLRQLTGVEARAITESALGLAIQESSPQVFLMASIAGSGSGMVMDVAYALRHALKDLDLATFDIMGLLFHATGDNPAETDLARINAYATLTELYHFSRQGPYPGDPAHGLPAGSPDDKPFGDCYLVHLGENLAEAQTDVATDAVAEYVFLNAASGTASFFQMYRDGTQTAPHEQGNEWDPRTFGLFRLVFPRYRLADQVTQRLCRQLIGQWQHGPVKKDRCQLRDQVMHKAVEIGLDLGSLEKRFRFIAQSVWERDPDLYLQDWLLESLASLSPQRLTESHEAIADQIAQRLDQLLGSNRREAKDPPPPMNSLINAFRKQVGRGMEELGDQLVNWLVALVDDPQERVASAVEATEHLVQHLHARLDETRTRLDQLRAVRESLPSRLGAATKKGSGNRWLGLVKRKAVHLDIAPSFHELCRARFQEVVLEQVMEVWRLISAGLSRFGQELTVALDKLNHFADQFQISTEDHSATPALPHVMEVLPRGAQNLTDAAEELSGRLGIELLADLDSQFQNESLKPQGGLWMVLARHSQIPDKMKAALFSHVRKGVLCSLREENAAKIFLETYADPALAQREFLDRVYKAAPPFLAFSEWHHLILAVPNGPAGAVVREIINQTLPDVPTTVLESDGDVIFCYEASHIDLPRLASSLIGNDPTLVEFARQVLTRVDVTWASLEAEEQPEGSVALEQEMDRPGPAASGNPG